MTSWTLTLATLSCLTLLLLLGVGPRTGAYRTLTMLSGSMRPSYPPGAVLVDRPIRPDALRVGQVLTYSIPVEDHRVVSHRVVWLHRLRNGHLDVQTKGDANNGPDPWRAHIQSGPVWVVAFVVPHAGRLLLWMRSPRLHLLLLYWLPLVALGSLLLALWRPEPGRGPA